MAKSVEAIWTTGCGAQGPIATALVAINVINTKELEQMSAFVLSKAEPQK